MSELQAIIRVRGRTHIKPGIADTLKYLGLTRKNYCTLIPLTPEYDGMLKKVKDYVTWGPADEKIIQGLLKNRGKITGDKKLTDSYLAENTEYKTINELAKALSQGQTRLNKIEGLKRIFRLNPPKKGFERKGIKAPYSVGGALGKRGEKIADLIERMI
jgi:large subunit ribosomal protein L30